MKKIFVFVLIFSCIGIINLNALENYGKDSLQLKLKSKTKPDSKIGITNNNAFNMFNCSNAINKIKQVPGICKNIEILSGYDIPYGCANTLSDNSISSINNIIDNLVDFLKGYNIKATNSWMNLNLFTLNNTQDNSSEEKPINSEPINDITIDNITDFSNIEEVYISTITDTNFCSSNKLEFDTLPKSCVELQFAFRCIEPTLTFNQASNFFNDLLYFTRLFNYKYTVTTLLFKRVNDSISFNDFFDNNSTTVDNNTNDNITSGTTPVITGSDTTENGTTGGVTTGGVTTENGTTENGTIEGVTGIGMDIPVCDNNIKLIIYEITNSLADSIVTDVEWSHIYLTLENSYKRDKNIINFINKNIVCGNSFTENNILSCYRKNNLIYNYNNISNWLLSQLKQICF